MKLFFFNLALLAIVVCVINASPSDKRKRRSAEETGANVASTSIQEEEVLLPDSDDNDSDVVEVQRRAPKKRKRKGGKGRKVKSSSGSTPQQKVDYGKDGGTTLAGGCTEYYQQVRNNQSIFCLPAYETYGHIMKYGVSLDQQAAITALHNTLRAGLPSANEQMMVWNEKIAAIAQKKAQSCTTHHDKPINRMEPSLPSTTMGQNLCFGHKDWETCINAWFNEIEGFTHGSKKNNFREIGHFTQMVKSAVSQLGCGFAYCSGKPFKHHFVCNYINAQTAGDVKEPFDEGAVCGDCPHTCDDEQLCNCNGTFCQNGGNLDLDSCDCTCTDRFEGSADCSVMNAQYVAAKCAKDDYKKCGEEGTNYAANKCTQIPNLPDVCPHQCGLCD